MTALPSPTEPTLPPTSSRSPTLGGFADLFLFLFVAVGLFLVVQYAAISLVVYKLHRAHPDFDWARLSQLASERVQYNAFFLVPVQMVFYALLVLLLVGLVRRRRLSVLQGLALRPLLRHQLVPIFLLGAVLALVIQMANALVPPPIELPFDRLFRDRAAALLVIAASLVVAPLVEELVFRGYIYSLLEPLWGTVPAVAASGLLFGAIHIPQLWPGYFQMASLGVVGIAFSVIRARTGTTTAAIAAHLAYNAAISVLFLISPQFRQLASLGW